MKMITSDLIRNFKEFLLEEEKAEATIEKYVHDVRAFMIWLSNGEVTKTKVLAYKRNLMSKSKR